MGKTTIGFGVLLILLGIAGYLGSAESSPTALIPAGFGIALAILGAIALNEAMRKHAMHVAAMLGLLGVLGAGRGVVVWLLGKPMSSLAVGSQLAMLLLCALFLGLCVNSFRMARRARAESGGAA